MRTRCPRSFLSLHHRLHIDAKISYSVIDSIDTNPRGDMNDTSDKIILSFGEILWDLLPTGEVLGGAPFNFAYRGHTLDFQSLAISRLGRDDYGRRAAETIAALGMNDRFVQWDDAHPTGTVQITLDDDNQPDYYIVPNVAYDFIACDDAILETASRAHCICFGTLAQRNPASREALYQILECATNALKVLDINLRKECHTPESIARSLQSANFLKLNEDEAPYLSRLFSLPADLPEFCAAAMERWSLSHCVVTLGARGVFARSSGGTSVYSPGFEIELADPCGSGDAFTAGFINRVFLEKPLSECCRFGNALGALVATKQGATVPISIDEIHAFLNGSPTQIVEESLRQYIVTK